MRAALFSLAYSEGGYVDTSRHRITKTQAESHWRHIARIPALVQRPIPIKGVVSNPGVIRHLRIPPGLMIERTHTHSLRARVREFVIPPIEDGLVLGRQSTIGHVAIGKALSFLSTTQFERVPVEDDVIGDIIVRAAILRKMDSQKLVEFVLQEIKPLMGPEEILHLHLEVDIHIEVSGT